jgi:hypothetical protein
MQWLTTTAASVFAGSGADEAAGFFGEAIGVFGGEFQADFGVGHGGAGHGIEGDGAALILDLEGQVFGGEDSGGGGDVEDAGKFAGREAVFGVVAGYPGLQDGGFGGTPGAAAVDESFFTRPTSVTWNSGSMGSASGKMRLSRRSARAWRRVLSPAAVAVEK